MDETVTVELTVNGINYRRPRKPIVVVCVDGGDATYYEQGLSEFSKTAFKSQKAFDKALPLGLINS